MVKRQAGSRRAQAGLLRRKCFQPGGAACRPACSGVPGQRWAGPRELAGALRQRGRQHDDTRGAARAAIGAASTAAGLRIKEARCTSPRQEHAQRNPSRTLNAKLLLKLEGRKPTSGEESRGATDKRVQVSCEKGRAWVAPRVERLSRETHCASITSSPVDMRACVRKSCVCGARRAPPSNQGSAMHIAKAGTRTMQSKQDAQRKAATQTRRAQTDKRRGISWRNRQAKTSQLRKGSSMGSTTRRAPVTRNTFRCRPVPPACAQRNASPRPAACRLRGARQQREHEHVAGNNSVATLSKHASSTSQ